MIQISEEQVWDAASVGIDIIALLAGSAIVALLCRASCDLAHCSAGQEDRPQVFGKCEGMEDHARIWRRRAGRSAQGVLRPREICLSGSMSGM
jgi:hypothetical protein